MRHFSPPYFWRGFLLTLSAALLLFPAPLQAQTGTPVPPSTIVGEFTTAAQTLGVVSVVAIIAMLILLVAVGALFAGIYRLGKPLVDNIATANQRADAAAAAERQAREEQQEASSTQLKIADQRERERQALRTREVEAIDSLGKGVERIANMMNENDKLSEEGRTKAVTAINAHVDEKIDELRRKNIEPMDAKLDVILKHVAPSEKPDDTAAPVAPSTPPAASEPPL